MTLLLLIILNSSGGSISSSTMAFTSDVKCLQAIQSILEMEKKPSITIKARCVKQ